MKLSPEEFIIVWRDAKSLDEIAEKSGSNKRTASMRAAYFRKKGVQMQKFASKLGRNKLDWDRLKTLAEPASNP